MLLGDMQHQPQESRVTVPPLVFVPSSQRRWRLGLALALAAALAIALLPLNRVEADPGDITAIVRVAPGAGDEAAQAVAEAGGTITAHLDVINGLTVEIPADSLASLAADPAILAVTEDTTVRLLSDASEPLWEDAATLDLDTNYVAADYIGSTLSVAKEAVETDVFWNRGYTGAGVDVALIDSGVVPVEGLTVEGKVINGPDLSFESQVDELRYLDTFGHGTHMAGIIAGHDNAPVPTLSAAAADQPNGFVGTAPDARIVNVKVADSHGAVDVSQVIAAIDWVVQHRNDNGMNIRVLNLSFGTDGTQDYRLDPLAYAVEAAWDAGIVVVVAAGNDGNGSLLRNPAIDPYVIAVGAADGTHEPEEAEDYLVPEFSNCGTKSRYVDVVAPGKSIVSLRNPGSYADQNYPEAVVDERFFLGSGTSQAAAFVSGAAALIIEQRPGISPDQVKALLMNTAETLKGTKYTCQGAGMIDLEEAFATSTPKADQGWARATGVGSLDLARGSFHLTHDGVELNDEQDIFGNKWNAELWAKLVASGASWSGGDWNGASWSGASWSGASWSGASWSGASWSGASWSGASWSGASWSGASWSGASWSGVSWSGASWSACAWSGLSWD
jgi:serine protease AprX